MTDNEFAGSHGRPFLEAGFRAQEVGIPRRTLAPPPCLRSGSLRKHHLASHAGGRFADSGPKVWETTNPLAWEV